MEKDVNMAKRAIMTLTEEELKYLQNVTTDEKWRCKLHNVQFYMDRGEGLEDDLRLVIALHNAERGSSITERGLGTPDVILAEYLMGCLAAYNTAAIERGRWYGRIKRIVNDREDKCLGE